MKRVRRERTAPEEVVAGMLREAGLRMRRNVRSLPGSPDFANNLRRLAIFVHGCFWHGHPSCALATVPKRNRAFWEAKLAANRKRDAAKVRALRTLGYEVLVLWQCKLRQQRTRSRIMSLGRRYPRADIAHQ